MVVVNLYLDSLYDNYNIGIGVASTLITLFADTNPFPLTKKLSEECFEQVKSSIKSIILANLILNNQMYDGLVLLNGRLSCEYSFKQVAIKKGIDIYFHERFFGQERFFFERLSLVHFY